MNVPERRRRPVVPLLAVAMVCVASFGLGLRVASRLTAVDVEGSLAQVRDALLGHDRFTQTAALSPILLATGPDQVASVAAVFEAAFASGSGGGLPLALFVERIAALDPVRARDRILTWPPERRVEALPVLVRIWARSDPPTAIEALNQIRDPQVRESAFPQLIQGWAESGQPGVWRYLAGVRGDMDRETGTIVLLKHVIAREGADAAIRALEQLPQEPATERFRADALRTAVGLLARLDPARATAIAEAQREGPEGGLLMRRVAVNWVTQDGPAAMAWLLEQPAGAQRDRVMREAYRRWLVRNRAAAMSWMFDRGDYRGLEAISGMYGTALTRVDPQAAVTWVSRIEDAELRRAAMADVAEVWHHQDPEAADPWIREVGLWEEIQRRSERSARLRPPAGPAALR